MPKKAARKTEVPIPLTRAMEMYHQGLAKISTGVVILTPKGRRKLGKMAEGVTFVIDGTQDQKPAK